jgi:hypothetical protein
MNEVIDRPRAQALEHRTEEPGLYVVWFDVSCGHAAPDWWWEDPGPQPLAQALDQSAEMRLAGWITIVCPERHNPRADGRWDNP